MGRFKKGWYARTEVKKVTLDWVSMNCKLTEREFDLLKIIHQRKLVRREHLEVISKYYRHAGEYRTDLLNRAIRKMFRKMCIDKVHEIQEYGKGNKPCIVALDKGGSLLLGIPHRKRIIHDISVLNGKEYIVRRLPANYKHINGVNQIEVDTINFCDGTGYVLSYIAHEKPVNLFYGQERVILIPDIILSIQFNTRQFCAFVEYDTGLENIRYKEPPIIRDKIVKYRKYMLSKLWQDEFDYFPFVLLVTEDDKRVEYFNKKCEEYNIRGFGIYYLNYTNFLKRLADMV